MLSLTLIQAQVNLQLATQVLRDAVRLAADTERRRAEDAAAAETAAFYRRGASR